jgi:hypothetical protein
MKFLAVSIAAIFLNVSASTAADLASRRRDSSPRNDEQCG